MTVAFDASTESAQFSAGTIGDVLYGGELLSPVVEAHDAAGELLGAFSYFLGSGIPTGAQTVEIKNTGGATLVSFTHTPVSTPRAVEVLVAHSSSTGTMIAYCVTQTADKDTAIEASGVAEEDQADPSVVLSTGSGIETYVISLFASGLGSPGTIAAGTGFTSIDSFDFGAQSAEIMDIDANDAGGGVTVLWNTGAAVDDVAVVALAIREVSSALLLPSADSVDGAWTDDGGGTSLAAAIDEASPSDTDYIQSDDSPSNSGCRVKLASGSDPGISNGHVIHWRVRKNVAGETINMTVKLYEGGGDSLGAGTLIATRTRNDVQVTTWVTFDEVLTGTEADSITDYSDLYLEFFADAV